MEKHAGLEYYFKKIKTASVFGATKFLGGQVFKTRTMVATGGLGAAYSSATGPKQRNSTQPIKPQPLDQEQ